MFICVNKWLVLLLVYHFLCVVESWPVSQCRESWGRRRSQGRSFRSALPETKVKTKRELQLEQESKIDTAPEATDRQQTDEGDILFDGDMVLDVEQVTAALNPKKRKATSDLRRLWPDGHVKFAIGPASEPDRAVILAAIEHWKEHTCITFEEVPITQPNDFAHVVFRKLTGCHSNVGKAVDKPDQAQTISIGVGCNRMGITAHEIGHSLGFYHEQSRPDRDEYIKLYTKNINPLMLPNFDLQPGIKYYGVPYDYSSVMHYAVDAFNINKKNTLVAKDLEKTYKVGQRQGLSFLDKKLANKMYKCTEHCTNEIACDNDGFISKKCECVCPPGFEGTYCQFKKPTDPAEQCGGYITQENTISTPFFPNNYHPGLTCVWEIEAPEGEIVSVNFVHFSLDFSDISSRRCFFDVVEIRAGPDMLDGVKYCGQELDGKEMTSNKNKMNILFHSTKADHPGFEAVISFLPA